MSTGEGKRLYVPTFSGNGSDFQVWWMRFLAYATVNGFAKAIGRTQDNDMPISEAEVLEDNEDGKRKEKAKRANALAVASLTLAFSTDALMGLVMRSSTSEWPNGLAWKVVEALFKKYRPEDVISMAELRRELGRISMKKEEDPTTLFDQLSTIENKYIGQSINEKDMIAVILDTAPKEYATTLTSEARNKGMALTLNDLREAMYEHWRIMYPGGKGFMKTETPEVSLTQQDHSGKRCYRCKKMGHMAYQCPEKNSNKGNKDNKNKNKTCNTCGKKGHVAADCWQDEKNESKAPEWFKKKQAKKENETGFVEILLCNLDLKESVTSEDDGIEEVEVNEEMTKGERQMWEDRLQEVKTQDGDASGLASTNNEDKVKLASTQKRDVKNTNEDSECEGNEESENMEKNEKCDAKNLTRENNSTRVPKIIEIRGENSVTEKKRKAFSPDETKLPKFDGNRMKWMKSDESSSSSEDPNAPYVRIWSLRPPDPLIKRYNHDQDNDEGKDKGNDVADKSGGKETDSKSETQLAQATMTFPEVGKLLTDPCIWIGDTGASVDSSPHVQSFQNIRKIPEGKDVTNADGKSSSIVHEGDITGMVCDKHGVQLQRIKMTNVKNVPTNKFNLLAINQRLEKGWQLHGTKNYLKLVKGKTEIKFDIKIKTKEGCIFAVYIETDKCGEMSNVQTDTGIRINPDKAHDILGHMDENRTRQAAKHLGWTITRGNMNCESCPIAKAKQKNVPKETANAQATKQGERVYLDMFSVKQPKEGPKVNTKNQGRVMVDEYSDCGFCKFFETKNGMVEPTLEQFSKWKQAKKPVKYVRCDNAGENRTLQIRSDSKDWKMNINFEFTARNTPQQNSKVEVRIATIVAKGRAMMHRANVPIEARYKIFPKAFETATDLDNLVIKEINGVTQTRIEHFCGDLPRYANKLRTWGEAGTVTVKKKGMPKIAD